MSWEDKAKKELLKLQATKPEHLKNVEYLKQLIGTNSDMRQRPMEETRKRMIKLEEALKFYADEKSWVVTWDIDGDAFSDLGARARKALEGKDE